MLGRMASLAAAWVREAVRPWEEQSIVIRFWAFGPITFNGRGERFVERFLASKALNCNGRLVISDYLSPGLLLLSSFKLGNCLITGAAAAAADTTDYRPLLPLNVRSWTRLLIASIYSLIEKTASLITFCL